LLLPPLDVPRWRGWGITHVNSIGALSSGASGFAGLKDGNFIHGSGYPRISSPMGTGMEGWLCPQISWDGYPINHGVGMGRGFAPRISNIYPANMWVPHVIETWDFT
jgi:hypothetical protein